MFLRFFIVINFRITLSLDVNGVALIYTSATLAAATTNCLPVITFFLAVLLRCQDLFVIIITFISFYLIHFENCA